MVATNDISLPKPPLLQLQESARTEQGRSRIEGRAKAADFRVDISHAILTETNRIRRESFNGTGKDCTTTKVLAVRPYKFVRLLAKKGV